MADDLTQFLIKAPAGKELFHEGDAGDAMYFIHSGRVRIEMDMDGKPEVLAILEKGDFFGEMAILDRAPRTATAVVDEDADLLKVDEANFEKLLRSNIEIAVRMIRKYAARLRDANHKLESLVKDKKELNLGIAEILENVKKPQDMTLPRIRVEALGELTHAGKAVVFAITKPQILIGRRDPVTNITPDIDLTELDEGRSISRRHARLEYVDGEFYLLEEVGVSNGTLVDGKRLKPGDPTLVPSGAKVQVGNVELVFKALKAS